MKIQPFELERFQSVYEHQVAVNLSESGVGPLRLQELLEARDLEGVLGIELAYSQTNGTPELRAAIADLYPGATPNHIEVTNGGSEANFLTCWSLVEPGDEVVVMHPNYLQTHLLAEAFGATVRAWRLRQEQSRWAADLDALRALVGDRTKLVVICNPNNPTGARLSASEVADICEIAGRHGAWLLADEIYRGAELDGVPTASAWGRYERAIVTGGLSKAYGLPGVRIGWLIGPPDRIETLWAHHDYTTIAPSAIGDHLARLALAPVRRRQLLDRARRILTANYEVVRTWVATHGDAVTHVPPEAGAIAFVQYRHDINSTELVTRLRTAESVLVVPGDQFGMDGFLRIGFGGPAGALHTGLSRLDTMLATIPTHAGG